MTIIYLFLPSLLMQMFPSSISLMSYRLWILLKTLQFGASLEKLWRSIETWCQHVSVMPTCFHRTLAAATKCCKPFRSSFKIGKLRCGVFAENTCEWNHQDTQDETDRKRNFQMYTRTDCKRLCLVSGRWTLELYGWISKHSRTHNGLGKTQHISRRFLLFCCHDYHSYVCIFRKRQQMSTLSGNRKKVQI